jgi:Uma2 family endonuclease
MNNLMLSRLSEQDYLHGELTSEIRHEYVDGEVFAMAGAGEAHNLISLNVAAKLRNALRGTPCRVFISDMRLHVKTWKAYYYPDVMVTCDTDVHDKSIHAHLPHPNPLPPAGEGANESLREILFDDTHPHYKERPSLVVEVLSPATERTDRREKMLAYRTLPMLREYLLISTYKKMIELYRRDEQEEWKLAVFSSGQPLVLDSIAASLTLEEIYEDVKLEVND